MPSVNHPPVELLTSIRLIAMDVDGVLTDGAIVWSAGASGELVESKAFNVRDGLGIGMALTAGLEVAWITGRRSAIVEKRAAELGVREVHQGSRDKRAVLGEVMARLGLAREQVLYLGDDVNDFPAFDAAGVRVTVPEAGPETAARAHWVTGAGGGRGAAREVIEAVLKAQGRWEDAVEAFLARLREEQARPLQ